MNDTFYISDEQARDISTRLSEGKEVDEDEVALLEMWRFFNLPPLSVHVTTDDTTENGFALNGDHLGEVQDWGEPGEGILLHGCNGIYYLGEEAADHEGVFLVHALPSCKREIKVIWKKAILRVGCEL